MSNLKKSRIDDAKVWFAPAPAPGIMPKRIGPFHALVDLFECDHEAYGRRIQFWYGVADVGVTRSEFH
jgi:hypothetical protein